MQRTQIKRIIELGIAQVNINHVDLGLAVAALAQEAARNRVKNASVSVPVNESGGTADVAFGLSAVVTPESATANGTSSFPTKEEFDGVMRAAASANATLRDAVNEVLSAINGGDDVGRRVEDDGTAAGGISTMPTDLTGGTDGVVDGASGLQSLVNARNNQASLAAAINYCRIACGFEAIRDGSGGQFSKSITVYPQGEVQDTKDGVGNGGKTLSMMHTNIAVEALRDNVATMAKALDEVVNSVGTIGPFVVATHNAHTRFAIGKTENV